MSNEIESDKELIFENPPAESRYRNDDYSPRFSNPSNLIYNHAYDEFSTNLNGNDDAQRNSETLLQDILNFNDKNEDDDIKLSFQIGFIRKDKH